MSQTIVTERSHNVLLAHSAFYGTLSAELYKTHSLLTTAGCSASAFSRTVVAVADRCA